MKSFIKSIKQSFCKHQFTTTKVANVKEPYTIYECSKCGKVEYVDGV